MTVHRTWQLKRPEWKAVVVGAVVVWSPESRALVKELGLEQRFDPSNPQNLLAELTAKYGRPSGGRSPPEVQQSRASSKAPIPKDFLDRLSRRGAGESAAVRRGFRNDMHDALPYLDTASG